MLDNQICLAIDFEFVWCILGEVDSVTDCDIDWGSVSIVQDLTWTDCDDFSHRWFFFVVWWEDDPTLGRCLLFDRFHDDVVFQWYKCTHSSCTIRYKNSRDLGMWQISLYPYTCYNRLFFWFCKRIFYWSLDTIYIKSLGKNTGVICFFLLF